MGNSPSRYATTGENRQIEDVEQERKLRTLAALSSRILATSGDTIGMLESSSPSQPSVSISPKPIQQIPANEKGTVKSIVSASLKGKDIENVPDEIYSLPNLSFLDLSNNRVKRLPDRIKTLKKLKRLALGSNKITEIPDWIGELKDLAWLDFTHNDVHTVSDEIQKLTQLTSLGASDCRLTTFPIGICRLPNIRKLGVFNNLINSLPSEIENLVHLTKLDLSGNALTRLPKEIGCLKELGWLNLSKNMLEELPEELGQLTKIKELGLAFNKLTRLPTMSAMKELSLLPIYNNELEEIPDWIVELTGLVKLDVSFNKIKKIPDGIFALPALTFINLRRNQLREVPPYSRAGPTQRSPVLQYIDLRENLLSFVPISLMARSIVEFKCAGNPLSHKVEPHHLTTLTEFRGLKHHHQLSMMDLASNAFFHHGLPENWLLRATPLIRSRLQQDRDSTKVCETCNKTYMACCGKKNLLFIEVTDVSCTPFLVEACSSNCAVNYTGYLTLGHGTEEASNQNNSTLINP